MDNNNTPLNYENDIVELCQLIKKVHEQDECGDHNIKNTKLTETKAASGKIVFIIGAGASYSSSVPLSSSLKEELVRGYGDLMRNLLRIKINSTDIDKELKRMPLEMAISLFNEIDSEKAGYQFLKSRLPNIEEAYYYPIPFAYEVISHLFYFRIVRHIISLNFDELLDRALDDELGERTYEKIYSRSSFERLIETGDHYNNRRKRFVFKPHGTISYRMTLRHSWEEVIRLDEEKKQILSDVISNARIIIAVGYSFKDMDLRGLIISPFIMNNPNMTKDTEENPKKLYLITDSESEVDKEPPIEGMRDNPNIKIIKTGSEHFFSKMAHYLFSDKHIISSVDWDEFYPGIQKHRARHLLLKGIYSEQENFKKYSNIIVKKAKCIQARLVVELLLFIANVKGKFRSAVILESPRIMATLKALQQYINKDNLIKPSDNTIRNALTVFSKVFIGNKMPNNQMGDETFNCIGDGNDEIERATNLVDELIQCLTIKDGLKLDLNNDDLKDLQNSLIAITQKLDITLARNTTRLIAFENPYIICGYQEFFKITREILSGWEDLKIISETGEWIKRELDKHPTAKPRNCKLIITNYEAEKNVTSFHYNRAKDVYDYLRGKDIDIGIWKGEKLSIPHHLNLNIKDIDGSNGKKKTGKAIYFYRYGRSIAICPILLSKEIDIEVLNKYFDTKWGKVEKNVSPY